MLDNSQRINDWLIFQQGRGGLPLAGTFAYHTHHRDSGRRR
jgi:hypothetical protein